MRNLIAFAMTFAEICVDRLPMQLQLQSITNTVSNCSVVSHCVIAAEFVLSIGHLASGSALGKCRHISGLYLPVRRGNIQ